MCKVPGCLTDQILCRASQSFNIWPSQWEMPPACPPERVHGKPCAAAKLVNRHKCNSFAPFSYVLCLCGATSYAFCWLWDFLWLFKKKLLSVCVRERDALLKHSYLFKKYIYVWCGYLVSRVSTLGFCLLMLHWNVSDVNRIHNVIDSLLLSWFNALSFILCLQIVWFCFPPSFVLILILLNLNILLHLQRWKCIISFELLELH